MDQSELIAQFCAITAADPEQAEQYLAVTDNDLENAISLFLESGGVSIASQRHAVSQDNSRQNPVEIDDEDDIDDGDGESIIDDAATAARLQQDEYNRGGEEAVRERIQPVTETLVDPGYSFSDYLRSSRPSAFNQRTPRPRQQNVFDQDQDYIEIDDNEDDDDDDIFEPADEDGGDNLAGYPPPRERDLRNRSTRMTAHESRLANLFRPPFDIISNLDLDLAKEQAQRQKKWLLVNIQDIHEFSCQQLNRDLWSDSRVKDTVRQNFIFLQYTNDTPDAVEYIQLYNFGNIYPHISILDPKTGEQLKVWDSVIEATQWLADVDQFLNTFSIDNARNNPLPTLSRHKTDVEHMTEEEQIEMAVRQSLGQPSNTADVSSSSTERPQDQPIDQQQVQQDLASDVAIDEPVTDQDVFATILPSTSVEPENDPTTTTRIQIRLGSGKRIIRRFKLNDSVREIYAVIKQQVPEVAGEYFLLTSERRPLLPMLDQTIEQSGLKNSVVLVEISD